MNAFGEISTHDTAAEITRRELNGLIIGARVAAHKRSIGTSAMHHVRVSTHQRRSAMPAQTNSTTPNGQAPWAKP